MLFIQYINVSIHHQQNEISQERKHFSIDRQSKAEMKKEYIPVITFQIFDQNCGRDSAGSLFTKWRL